MKITAEFTRPGRLVVEIADDDRRRPDPAAKWEDLSAGEQFAIDALYRAGIDRGGEKAVSARVRPQAERERKLAEAEAKEEWCRLELEAVYEVLRRAHAIEKHESAEDAVARLARCEAARRRATPADLVDAYNRAKPVRGDR